METAVSLDKVMAILQAKAQNDPALKAQIESAMWQAAAEQALERLKVLEARGSQTTDREATGTG